MIHGFQNYIDFFNTIAAQIIPLKGNFVYGDANRVLSEQRSRLNYPCLWVETPSWSIVETQSGKQRVWQGFVVILHQAKPDDWAEEQANMTNVMRIADYLHRILSESDAFFAIDGISAQPISTFGIDSDLGLRIGFRMYTPICACIECPNDTEIWYNPTALPRLNNVQAASVRTQPAFVFTPKFIIKKSSDGINLLAAFENPTQANVTTISYIVTDALNVTVYATITNLDGTISNAQLATLELSTVAIVATATVNGQAFTHSLTTNLTPYI